MTHRYKIQAFETADRESKVEPGTVVLPSDRVFSLFARSVNEAERKIQDDVAADRLPKGRVYQVCPPFGNSESLRAFAVSLDGVCRRVYLDPASGSDPEFRRIRDQDLRVNLQREEVPDLQHAFERA